MTEKHEVRPGKRAEFGVKAAAHAFAGGGFFLKRPPADAEQDIRLTKRPEKPESISLQRADSE